MLSGDENPAQRILRPHLRSVEQFRVLGDEGLQFVLLLEALAFDRFELSPLVSGVDALGHISTGTCETMEAISNEGINILA